MVYPRTLQHPSHELVDRYGGANAWQHVPDRALTVRRGPCLTGLVVHGSAGDEGDRIRYRRPDIQLLAGHTPGLSLSGGALAAALAAQFVLNYPRYGGTELVEQIGSYMVPFTGPAGVPPYGERFTLDFAHVFIGTGTTEVTVFGDCYAAVNGTAVAEFGGGSISLYDTAEVDTIMLWTGGYEPAPHAKGVSRPEDLVPASVAKLSRAAVGLTAVSEG